MIAALLIQLGLNIIIAAAAFAWGRITAPRREIPIDLSEELPARIRRAEGAEVLQFPRRHR
jgi:hypothetical protein